jgi:hypothetical protein
MPSAYDAPPLEANRESDRRAERARSTSAPSTRCHEATAEVPSAPQDDTHREEPDCGGDHHEERPPHLAGEGTRLLGPPDRREPRQRAVSDVADGTEHERRGKHGARDAVHDARVLAHLRCHERHTDEDEAEQRERDAEGDGAFEGKAQHDEDDRDDGADDHVHERRHEGRGRRGRVGTHREGSEEFEAARLLLATRESPDHQQAHQRDDDEPERTHLERDLPADGVEALRWTVERDRGRVVLGCDRGLEEIGTRRIQALDARDGRQHERADRHDPHDDPDAVSPHCEAGDRRRPGEGLGGGHASRSTGSRSSPSSSP